MANTKKLISGKPRFTRNFSDVSDQAVGSYAGSCLPL